MRKLKTKGMKQLFTVLVMTALLSCSKNKDVHQMSNQRTDFFANESVAAKTVQTALDKKKKGEKLEKIESISYIDGKDKSYAFIFYKTNMGGGNLVIERGYVNNQLILKSTTCEGEECTCKVKTVIASNGEVSLACSCKSCSMVIDNFADSELQP